MNWIVTCPHGHQHQVAQEEAGAGGTLHCPACNGAELPQIPNYEIRGELGGDSKAVVYKAWEPGLNRMIALKLLRAGQKASPTEVERFRLEADVVANLDHLNIVSLKEVGESNGWPYLVFEYLAGGSLAQRQGGNPMPARKAAELVQTLARAVHFIHQRGIIHHHLEPANILLTGGSETPPGLPKIAGFGLAKRIGDARPPKAEADAGTVPGTPSYLAPEQVAGRSDQIGTETDIYALGAILYELLTGRPPFKAPTPEETLEQVGTVDPAPPSHLQPAVPRDLEAICLKCLEKEPHRRYATAEDLAEDLDRFLLEEPVLARPAGPGRRLWKWARRQPVWAALAGMGILAGLALVAVLVGRIVVLQDQVERDADARADAGRRQQAAEANYKKARDMADHMLARLEDKGLPDVPELRDLHKGLLEDALAFYQDALKGPENPEPSARPGRALAYYHAGKIQAVLGRNEPARDNLHQARLLFEKLLEDHPDSFDYLSRLADTYNALGVVCLRLDPPEEVEKWYQKAVEHREKLHRARPRDPAVLNDLAQSHYNHGLFLINAQELQKAEPHFVAAAALREELVRAHPKVMQYQASLADRYLDLALLYRTTNQKPKAIQTYKRARAMLESLVRNQPEALYTASALAMTFFNWAEVLYEENRTRAALDLLADGIRVADEVLRRDPRFGPGRIAAFKLYGSRALVRQKQKHYAEAVKDLDRVVGLADGPQRDASQLERAMALAHAGDHARAAAEARALDAKAHGQGVAWFQLACVYSVAAGAAREDRKLAAPGRTHLEGEYAAQAVALLRKCLAGGLFKTPVWLGRLEAETELAAIRSRADFQKLLRQAEEKK
jgi:tetratricopeptide (TPR) repeat protein